MIHSQNAITLTEYRLTLSDGTCWWLSGADDNISWVDRWAAIMGLKAGKRSGSPKLIFSSTTNTQYIKNNRIASYINATLSSQGVNAGWRINDPASLKIWRTKNVPDVLCKVNNDYLPSEYQYINMWYALFPIYYRSIYKGGLPFHSGLVEWNSRGILLAAPGGTGKSTCCRRLPDNWRPLSDDEALVVLEHQDTYRAHPFPTWGDYLNNRKEKTWNVEYSIPLAGIFFIQQSETDGVEPLGEGKAAVLITESAMQVCEKFWRPLDKENKRLLRRNLFNNAGEMVKKIPAYRLLVSRHGRFWEKMEQVLC